MALHAKSCVDSTSDVLSRVALASVGVVTVGGGAQLARNMVNALGGEGEAYGLACPS